MQGTCSVCGEWREEVQTCPMCGDWVGLECYSPRLKCCGFCAEDYNETKEEEEE